MIEPPRTPRAPRTQRKTREVDLLFLCLLGALGALGVLGGSIDPLHAALSVPDLGALAEQAKHEQVVAAADATVAALPPAKRLVAWRIDFGDAQIARVLIGARRAYYVRNATRGTPFDPKIELIDRRPSVRHDEEQNYNEENFATCVETATGRKLWSRRLEGFQRFLL